MKRILTGFYSEEKQNKNIYMKITLFPTEGTPSSNDSHNEQNKTTDFKTIKDKGRMITLENRVDTFFIINTLSVIITFEFKIFSGLLRFQFHEKYFLS